MIWMVEGFIHELCKIQVFFHPFLGKMFLSFFQICFTECSPKARMNLKNPKGNHPKIHPVWRQVCFHCSFCLEWSHAPWIPWMIRILAPHLGWCVLQFCGIGRQHRTLTPKNACSTRTCVFHWFRGSFQNCLFLYGRLFRGFNWQFWVRREPYVDGIWIPENAPFAISGPKLPPKDTLIVDGSLDIWRTFLIKLVETHHFYHNLRLGRSLRSRTSTRRCNRVVAKDPSSKSTMPHKKRLWILQEDKSLCFLVDMNLSASGQQRIELGSLFCVASAGRSDFTLF